MADAVRAFIQSLGLLRRGVRCDTVLMRSATLLVSSLLVLVVSGCGSHTSPASLTMMRANSACGSEVLKKLHLSATRSPIESAFAHKETGGRIRITGTVSERDGVGHPRQYVCVVVSDASHLRVARVVVRPFRPSDGQS